MHHSRKKSGHGLPNTSMTDVRKAVTATDPAKYKRPAMTRKQTPQKLGRSQREREREWSESWEDERESFPQFWYVLTSALGFEFIFFSSFASTPRPSRPVDRRRFLAFCPGRPQMPSSQAPGERDSASSLDTTAVRILC